MRRIPKLPLAIKILIGYVGAAGGVTLLILATGAAFRPDFSQPIAQPSPTEIAAAVNSRDWLPGQDTLPVIWRQVDYAQGSRAPWFPRREAPLLHELVQTGKLPPVAARTGPEPAVLEGVDGTGRYGGSWYHLAVSDSDITGLIRQRLSYAELVRWSPGGYPIVPHLAREWTVSPDQRVYTLTLRQGVRWSDGHPFTAADILYWWEHEALYFQMRPNYMRVAGELGTIEKVNDLQVRFVFPQSHGLFLERLASADVSPYAPRHYLEKFHPVVGDQALIRTTLRAMQMPGARALYNRLRDPYNPACPRMWPWIYRQYSATPPQSFVRNPYYFAVDTVGQQLPYLDRVVFDIKAKAFITTAMAAGDVSMQSRHTDFQDYTLLASQTHKGGYQLYHWYPSNRTLLTFFPNLNRRIHAGDPATVWKHRLLNERDFRRALSLAIDRRTIIDAVYNGVGEPAQAAPGPGSPYHHERLLRSFIAYDPGQANTLLDGLGLTQRDHEGFRTFPDGTRMTFLLSITDTYPADSPLLVAEDWKQVGVRTVAQSQDRSLYEAKAFISDYDILVWFSYDGFLGPVESRDYLPIFQSYFAPDYGRWYHNGGLHGDPRARQPGSLAPPPGSDILKAMTLLDQVESAPTVPGRIALFHQALDLVADNVWSISFSTAPPLPVVVKNGFRNVPRHGIEGFLLRSPGNMGIETFYWDIPETSPGVTASVQAALDHPPALPLATLPDAAAGAPPGGSGGAWLFWIITATVLGLISLRHRFVWHRLLIMVPTLIVISIVVFTILQLPPTDFISSKIIRLEMEGDGSARAQIEDLRAAFHFDKSPVERYLYWSGLMWFFTGQPQDTGLLQGNLGRSMDSNLPVTTLMGERLTLTVIISFFTILLIWLVAIPIGIFSAVRQHSAWDYSLTLFGFLGMSIPPFLLALVLMYIGSRYFGFNVSGLFSPQYGAQPDWDWGKFVDLLKRIWVPVLVVGAGSVAAMIRIMRANLLDELKKPYVTTARAKGMRPVRLLLKYPVRMAINPFVSGIGSLFPHLVSGDSIVAIVLSLPTIGPLLLHSLLSLDIYLAASLLMILSLLSVAGTLISDLLLQWLDPRMQVSGNRIR